MSDRRLDIVRGGGKRCGFTLAELLVVMAIIALLAGFTVVAVGKIANDARLSSGRNTVVASLENARALAMKSNKLVMVAFRARFVGEGEQVIETITAEWSGISYFDSFDGLLIDRFVLVADAPIRELPSGIKVAAPLYLGNVDTNWVVSTNLPTSQSADPERAGPIIAVMYGPDGTRVSQNVQNSSDASYIDFNGDFLQRQNDVDFDYNPNVPLKDYCDLGNDNNGNAIERYYCQRIDDDEPYVLMAPYLALFDDDEARELNDPSEWTDGQTRVDDLTRYISERADRIHFNRYTGVVMK